MNEKKNKLIGKAPTNFLGVYHIWIEAFNFLDQAAISEGQVVPPVAQLSLIIEPDPTKFGNSEKLLRLSNLFYLLGGLITCITLLIAISTYWSMRDLSYHFETQ